MTVTPDFFAPVGAGAPGTYKFYCEGSWRESTSGKTVKILNPCTNAPAFSVQGAARGQCWGPLITTPVLRSGRTAGRNARGRAHDHVPRDAPEESGRGREGPAHLPHHRARPTGR